MALSPGTRHGPYMIGALSGAGGMGEVYRAFDPRLGRDVALKVLPRAFTSDPDRLARFEREARMLAALNHPNIAAIYGIEETDGIPALVLELVEGETLYERIALRPLALAEALQIARQIADALDAAHERAIVHRDLKPSNVKITRDGIVKVLDFGLAKGIQDPAGRTLTLDPTLGGPETRAGVVLGTAAYMSPEQARGQTVDKRSDIWAFGCVLYEMCASRSAFGRDTVSDTIVAILEGNQTGHRCLTRSLRPFGASCGGAWRRIPNAGCATLEMQALIWTTRRTRRSPRLLLRVSHRDFICMPRSVWD